MSLTLYDLPYSPYCILVRRIFSALGLPVEVVDVPNWDRRAVLEITAGAYYQVPVIVHGERVVYESGPGTNDVARYMNDMLASGRLLPKEHEGLQEILIDYLDNEVEGTTFRVTDAFYVDSINDPVARGMVRRHKERKFGAGCIVQWQEKIKELRCAAEFHFERFDAMLRHKPFLLGEQPVYADFLLYGIVGNYTWQDWNQIPDRLSSLQRWREAVTSFSF